MERDPFSFPAESWYCVFPSFAWSVFSFLRGLSRILFGQSTIFVLSHGFVVVTANGLLGFFRVPSTSPIRGCPPSLLHVPAFATGAASFFGSDGGVRDAWIVHLSHAVVPAIRTNQPKHAWERDPRRSNNEGRRRRDEDEHGTCAQEEDPSHARTRRRRRNRRRRRWTRTRNATAHVDSTKQYAVCRARNWKRSHHQNGRGASANDRGRTYTKKKRNGTDAIGRTQPTTHET